MPDKLSIVMSGVVGDEPDLLEDLERHDRHIPSFIEPHLLDGPNVSGGVHPTQPRVAVTHKHCTSTFPKCLQYRMLA